VLALARGEVVVDGLFPVAQVVGEHQLERLPVQRVAVIGEIEVAGGQTGEAVVSR